MGKGNNYNNFFNILYSKYDKKKINNIVNIIFEIGSRDALDGLYAHDLFNASATHIFECNRTLITNCLTNIGNKKNIYLCDKALSDKDNDIIQLCFPVKLPGDIDTWNGMGSLKGKTKKEYWINTNHSFKHLNDENSKYVTENVNTITLNTYCNNLNINNIDLILLDVEGMPLQILKYFNNIKNTKIIISEIYYDEIFEKGNDTFIELDNYLNSNNFVCIVNDKKDKYFGNAMWINRSFL